MDSPHTKKFCLQHARLNSITPGRERQIRTSLALLEQWAITTAEQLTDRDLVDWMTWLMDGNRSASTVRKHLHAVKPFYRWAYHEGLIERDVWDRILEVHPPRGAKVNAVPRPYSRAEVARFWSDLAEAWPQITDEKYMKRVKKGTVKYRQRTYRHGMNLQVEAIVSLALYLGLRRGEIYGLSLDDLATDNAYLVIRGKREDQNEKVRTVPYNESARSAVGRWLRWRKMLGAEHDRPWLSLAYADKTTTPMCERRFGVLLLTVGKWSLHRMRHTCATERLRNGMPIEKLQVFLGHASIQQTLLYAKIDWRDVNQAMIEQDEAFMYAVGKEAAA